MEYDVFICHASEDKADFVEPLAQALQKEIKVWYDRFELKLGDSLREKIDNGLANSRYGVVILSKAFFSKKWPKEELDALVTRQNNEGKKVILPIWHKVEAEEVGGFSPILASKLAARSSDGIAAVVAQILDVCKETHIPKLLSVFQEKGKYGLREECFDIIRQDDIIAWRKLLIANTELIPEKLKKWKQDKGDVAAHKGGKEWEDALIEAANICMPGFVPIFVAVEAGKSDFWREAMGFTKRLFILRDEMGGGSEWAMEVGYHILYIVGSLGLSIAAGLKLFDIFNEWMLLKMPYYSGGEETQWAQIRYAHTLPGVSFNEREPFRFLLSISQSELLKSFFTNQKRLSNNLLMANLLASMVEFRLCCQNTNCLKALQGKDPIFSFDIPPFWCLTPSEDFRVMTLSMFNDSDGVVNFVFPQKSAVSARFWQYWNNWHRKCLGAFSWDGRVRFTGMFLRLPGQPDLREDASIG
jgi:hypothetical protein